MDLQRKLSGNRLGLPIGGFSKQVFHRLAMQEIEDAQSKEAAVPLWLEPPPHLSDTQSKLWRNAVVTRGPEWFKPGDLFLLEEYVNTCVEVTMFRRRCVISKWAEADERAYNRAITRARRYSQDLSLTLAQRVSNSARLSNGKPMTAAEEGTRLAMENAQDPLLQGFQMPELAGG